MGRTYKPASVSIPFAAALCPSPLAYSKAHLHTQSDWEKGIDVWCMQLGACVMGQPDSAQGNMYKQVWGGAAAGRCPEALSGQGLLGEKN